MTSSSLGLLQTKPGTALGGRSRSQLPKNSVPSNLNTDKSGDKPAAPKEADALTSKDRDRSMLSQVHLQHTSSDVSSIPDFDIFSYTETEVVRYAKSKNMIGNVNEEEKEKKTKKKDATDEETLDRNQSLKSVESDLFSGLDDKAAGNVDKASAVGGAKKKKKGSSSHVRKTSDSTNLVSNVTGKFSSPAANNYYNAMMLGKGSSFAEASTKSIKTEGAGGGGKKKSLLGGGKSKKANGKKSMNIKKSSDTKKTNTDVKADKAEEESKTSKSLEELVTEALSVAKTPEEVAQYLLAQDAISNGGTSTDKKALLATILAKQNKQTANNNRKGVSSDGSIPGVPPVTSLECGSNPHDLVSTTSSITHNSFHTKSVCSVHTEKRDTDKGVSNADNNQVNGNAKGVNVSDDPPIAEYPSPINSPNDESELGYPDMKDTANFGSGSFSMPDKLKLIGTIGVEEEDAIPTTNNKYAKDCCAKTRNSDASTAASTNPSVSTPNPASETNGSISKSQDKRPSVIQEEPLLEESVEHDLSSYQASFEHQFDSNNAFKDAKEKPPLPDAFSQARRVNDALSVTGSSIVRSSSMASNRSAKKNSASKGIGRVRSMSPMLFKKKNKGVEEGDLANIDEDPKEEAKANDSHASSSIVAKKSTAQSKTLRAVRSMSPALFSSSNNKTTSKNIDPAIERSDSIVTEVIAKNKYEQEKSSAAGGGNTSDVSTAASSSSPASAGSAVILLPPTTDNVLARSMLIPSTKDTSPPMKPDTSTAKDDELPTEEAQEKEEDPRECITPSIEKTASSNSGDSKASPSIATEVAKPPMPPSHQSKGNKQAPLPPRIPSRSPTLSTPPSQDRSNKIVTTASEDDGSVECSVLSNDMSTNSDDTGTNKGEMLQLSANGKVVSSRLTTSSPSASPGGVISIDNASPGVDSNAETVAMANLQRATGAAAAAGPVIAADSDDGSIEVSVFDRKPEVGEDEALETAPTDATQPKPITNKSTPKKKSRKKLLLKKKSKKSVDDTLLQVPQEIPASESSIAKDETNKSKEADTNATMEENVDPKKSDVNDESPSSDEAPAEAVAATSTPKKKKKKKSRMELAKEKLAKHHITKGWSKDEASVQSKPQEQQNQQQQKQQQTVAEPAKETDITITRSSSTLSESKERKKEKLQKIMDYRKKASERGEGTKKKKSTIVDLDDEVSDDDEEKEEEKNRVYERQTDSAPRVGNGLSRDARLALSLERKRSGESTGSKKRSQQAEIILKNKGKFTGLKSIQERNRRETLEILLEEEEELKKEKVRLEEKLKQREKEESSKHEESRGQDEEQGEKQQPKLANLVELNKERSLSEAPVRHVDVYPNALEYDDADVDISLPPELKKGKEKVKIWHEEGISLGDDASKADTQILADKCMTCGTNVGGDDDMDNTIFDIPTLDEENNTLLDKTEGTASMRKGAGRRRSITGGMGPLFACGMDPAQIKNDIAYEARETVKDIKYGVRKSIRNLFGACDITRDGGLDVLIDNVNEANDQLFGRVPVSNKQGRSGDENEEDTNPQAQKMNSILNGTDRRLKVKMPKNEDDHKKKLNQEEKQRLYLEKLKAVSLKHL